MPAANAVAAAISTRMGFSPVNRDAAGRSPSKLCTAPLLSFRRAHHAAARRTEHMSSRRAVLAPHYNHHMRLTRALALPVLAVLFATAACSRPGTQDGSAGAAAGTASQPQIPIGQLPPIDADAILARTRTLSSDEFEGRGPGTRGEDLTVQYLVDEFTKLGLKPGNTDGTYIQKVPLVGITPDGAPLVFRKGAQQQTLKWHDDVVAWTKHVAPSASIENSELVFVGYGVVAPEFDWDDYKGVDVTGKTLVMLVNDPPVPDPSNADTLDAKTFGGKAMTYYGRWTYKYEIGKEKGAAGVLIIHETDAAGYPFDVVQSKVTEQFDLVTPDKNMSRVAIEGWITLGQGRKLLQMAGQDFDALKKLAATRAFKPVPLGVTASMTLHNTLRTVDSRNVIAKLEGSDPRLKDEYIIYTAHWDHLGVGTPVGGDRIYNGAQDNAVGCAGLLELASAFTKLAAPPRRSILFLSVTAEEQGLLGSEYYSVMPIYPLARTLADINIDGLNVHGRTKDIILVGLGASDLDDYVRAAAAEQGRIVKPDAEPEKGFYYRSDHFNFAKQGVPALDPDQGIDYVGKPADFGQKVRNDYTEHRYHSPSDVVLPDWDLSGAREDLRVLFAVGYRIAQAEKYPEWKPGNEFRAKREAMLKS
jgi:Zn-dependent M28 family amino/carboxypeptidase